MATMIKKLLPVRRKKLNKKSKFKSEKDFLTMVGYNKNKPLSLEKIRKEAW